MKKIRVILVDDHYLVRLGVRGTFATAPQHGLDIEIVGEAENAAQFYSLLEGGCEADLVLLDVFLPDSSGLEIAQQIYERAPHLKVLLLSAECNAGIANHLATAPINGYINKGSSPKELFCAIESVVSGESYYCKDMAALMHSINVAKGGNNNKGLFTPKESEVLQLAARGLYLKEIADKLGISDKTVSVHKSNIFKKLGINNTAELVTYAIKMGLVKP